MWFLPLVTDLACSQDLLSGRTALLQPPPVDHADPMEPTPPVAEPVVPGAAGVATAGTPATIMTGSISTPPFFQRIVERHAALRHCYEKARRRDRDLEGVLVLRLQFGPTGALEQLRTSGLDDRELAWCVGLALVDLQVDGVRSSATLVTFPLRFLPAESASNAEEAP